MYASGKPKLRMYTLLAGYGFALYLMASTCSWPVTTRDVYREGGYLGFVIGESKETTFDKVLARLREGSILRLERAESPPAGGGKRLRWSHSDPPHFDQVSSSDVWYCPIAGRNAWIYLEFASGHLEVIEVAEYLGPTE